MPISGTDIIHIVPLDDIFEHDFTEGCACHPTPKPEGAGVIVVHNSHDLREHVERAQAILNNH